MALVLIVVVGMAGWFLMPAKDEPRYEGKTVKEWFNEIPVTRTGDNSYTIGQASTQYTAMICLKEQAVPFLLKEIKKTDSSGHGIHRLVYSWLNRLSGDYIMSDQERRIRILQCFHRIGLSLKEAKPELIEMARAPKYSSTLAQQILQRYYPDAATEAGIKPKAPKNMTGASTPP
jgi:hypothetical protein